MIELFVVGFAIAVALAVVALVCWVFVIPFQILGLVFKGLAALLVLPFLVVFGIIAAALFGVGFLLFAIPALPLLLIVGAIWWLARGRRQPHLA